MIRGSENSRRCFFFNHFLGDLNLGNGWHLEGKCLSTCTSNHKPIIIQIEQTTLTIAVGVVFVLASIGVSEKRHTKLYERNGVSGMRDVQC